MVTRRAIHGGLYTETKRVVYIDGEPSVKVVVCCCEAAGSTAKGCATVAGNKRPCQCACHRGAGRKQR